MARPSRPPRSPRGRGGPPRLESVAEARARVEQERAAARAARQQAMRERFGDAVPGRWILLASWISTALFALVSVPALIDPERFVAPFFVVAVGLFFLGCAAFVLVLVLAAARSRDDAMGIGGLFFLAGSAPRNVQLHLLGSLAAQILIAVVAAAVRPFTPLAFGTLVPILPLALTGLWAVRHGLFDPVDATGDPGSR